jgi:hypothetical protein
VPIPMLKLSLVDCEIWYPSPKIEGTEGIRRSLDRLTVLIGGEDVLLLITQGQGGSVVQREADTESNRRCFSRLQLGNAFGGLGVASVSPPGIGAPILKAR